MIAFLHDAFVPDTFNSNGSIVDDDTVGIALETQTRPVHSRVARSAQTNFYAIIDIPAVDSFWDLTIAEPGPFGLFHDAIYDRGAATLLALRVKIGDDAFFAAAQEWLVRDNDSTGTTKEFEAIYGEVAGQDLDLFVDVWLRTPSKPTTW